MSMALQNPVLVLNKNWQAYRTATVWWALRKVYAGRAVIVGDDYSLHTFDQWLTSWRGAIRQSRVAEDRLLNCLSCYIVIPEVVRTTEYGGYHPCNSFSRRNVFLRDNNTCQYCGQQLPRARLNIDHVVPKSRGGGTSWENVVLSCIPCNNRKDNRTPDEANMALRRPPAAPHWTQLAGHPQQVPPSWERFLGELYWNIELRED